MEVGSSTTRWVLDKSPRMSAQATAVGPTLCDHVRPLAYDVTSRTSSLGDIEGGLQ
jgi:hypothetical protein